jgi:TRAP-type C4-dicarboxylate transport system permease small subunit
MLLRLIANFMHKSFWILGPICYLVVFGVVMFETASYWSQFYFHSPVLEASKSWLAWVVGFVFGWVVSTVFIGAQILIMDLRRELINYVKGHPID